MNPQADSIRMLRKPPDRVESPATGGLYDIRSTWEPQSAADPPFPPHTMVYALGLAEARYSARCLWWQAGFLGHGPKLVAVDIRPEGGEWQPYEYIAGDEKLARMLGHSDLPGASGG